MASGGIISYHQPIPDLSTSDHPVLQWYATYGRIFSKELPTIDAERFYSARCLMVLPDYSTIEGGAKMVDFIRSIYLPFHKVERTIRNLTLIPNSQGRGDFELHYEGITTVFPKANGPGIPIPQSFVYVIGTADEGKGTDGFQYHELRNFYDLGLLNRALAQIEK